MDIPLLADWTDLPWADYGIAGSVIMALLSYIFVLRRDVMGLANRVARMADENAARLERLTGEYADNIKENTRVTAALTGLLRYLAKNGNLKSGDATD